MSMENKQEQQYDMRAAPRRRIKGDDAGEQPLFLRKAFSMITSCPEDIGGWSEKGDTVVIKDAKRFAEEIIPTCYKHNNFSSFVRQLNFYGFRKIKSETTSSDVWEFRHASFLRGQPEKLSEIKRSVHFAEPPNTQEVTTLKTEVVGLNERIAALHDQIDKLTGLVTTMQVNKADSCSTAATTITMPNSSLASVRFTDADNKKRKLSVPNSTPPLMRMTSVEMISDLRDSGVPLASGPELLKNGLNLFSPSTGVESRLPTVPEQEETHLREELNTTAVSNIWDVGDDDFEFLLDSPPVEPQMLDSNTEIPQASPIVSTAQSVNSTVNDVTSVLESLSPELKVRFVDKLAEVMGKQLAVNMVPPVATAKATQAPQQSVKVECTCVCPEPMPKSDTSVTLGATNTVTVMNSEEGKAPSNQSHIAGICGDSAHVSNSSTQSCTQTSTTSHAASSPTLMLPTGEQAPDIAMPLASAALGAFIISSLNSLVPTPPQRSSSQQGPMMEA